MNILKQESLIILIVIATLGIYLTIPSDREIGTIYFKSNQIEDAFKHLTKAKLKNEDDILLLKELKNYHSSQGNFDKSILLLKKMHDSKPRNLNYIDELIKIFSWTHQNYNAFKFLELKYSKMQKSISETKWFTLALNYQHIKKFKDAKRIYQKLIHSNSKEILEHGLKFSLLIKDIDESKVWAKNLLKKYYDPRVHIVLAEILDLDKKPHLSLRHYLLSIDKNLVNPSSIPTLSNSKIKKDYQKIKKVYYIMDKLHLDNIAIAKKLFFNNPSSKDLTYELLDLFRAKNVYTKSNVLPILSTHYFKMKKNENSLRTIAIEYSNIKEYTKAISIYEILIHKFKAKKQDYKEIATLYSLVNKKKKAIEYFYKYINTKKTIGRSPSSKQEENVDVILQIATLHFELKEYKKAKQLLMKNTKSFLKNKLALEILLQISIKEKQNSKSVYYSHLLRKIDPNHLSATEFLLNYFLNNNKLDNFKKILTGINHKLLKHQDIIKVRLRYALKTNNKKEINTICNHIIKDSSKKKLILQCHLSTKNIKEALSLYKKILFSNPKDKNLFNDAIYFALNNNLIEDSEYFINYKKNKIGEDKNTLSQNSYLKYLKNKNKIEQGFYISQSLQFERQKRFSFFTSNNKVEKNINSEFRLKFKHKTIFSNEINPIQKVTPYLSYKHNNFIWDNGLNIFTSKDIKPFLTTNLTYKNKNFYIHGNYEKSYNIASKSSLTNDKSHNKTLSLYTHISNMKNSELTFYIENQRTKEKIENLNQTNYFAKYHYKVNKLFKPGLYYEKLQNYRQSYFGPGFISNFKYKKLNLTFEYSSGLDSNIKVLKHNIFSKAEILNSDISNIYLFFNVLRQKNTLINTGLGYNLYI